MSAPPPTTGPRRVDCCSQVCYRHLLRLCGFPGLRLKTSIAQYFRSDPSQRTVASNTEEFSRPLVSYFPTQNSIGARGVLEEVKKVRKVRKGSWLSFIFIFLQ